MDTLRNLVDILLHLNTHLNGWVTSFGGWVYVLLFAIVFSETGLVVTPFLPGDSLLFAVGALAALDGSPLSLPLVILVLFVAGVTGDAVNYSVGHSLGPKAFTRDDSFFFNKKHLFRTQAFYEKHGGKTIIIARFVPIVRTFAPFVAGIGRMGYRRFALFNVVGAGAWVLVGTGAGYVFGNIPMVKNNFERVIVFIIFLSVLPIVVEYLRERARTKVAGQA